MKDLLIEDLDVEFNNCVKALFERKKSLLNEIELKFETERMVISTHSTTKRSQKNE